MSELHVIHKAFIDSFSPSSLERLVKFALDVDIVSVSSGDNFSTIVFELLLWAKREGKLEELINSAKLSLPNNKQIQKLSYQNDLFEEVPESRSEKILMESSDNISNAIILIRQLERQVETLQKIVVGEDWGAGVRAVSADNNRKIIELHSQISSLQKDFASFSRELSQEFTQLKVSVSRLENKPDDILSSPKNKAVFGIIILLLLIMVGLVAAGSFGWMQ